MMRDLPYLFLGAALLSSDTVSATLRYWEQIFIQEAQATPECPADDGTNRAIIPQDDLVSGSISAHHVKRFTDPKKSDEENANSFPVPVLVAPWVIEKADKKANSTLSSPQAIYWIPALLQQDGTIHPFENGLPFLNRKLQYPSDTPTLEVVNQKDYTTLLTEQEHWKKDWQRLIYDLASEFVELTDEHPAEWIPEGYKVASGAIMLLEQDTTNLIGQNLIRLCRYFSGRPNGLLTSFITPQTAKPLSKQNGTRRYGCYLKKGFPLNEKQSDVADAVSDMPEGSLIAVNGPPGTGKTSMLTGVVANIVTQATLKGDDAAVIQLASTNNQAVKNAIDEFSKISVTDDIESQRWIPGDFGYGVLIPANSKKGEAEKDGITTISALRSQVFDPNYIETALSFWRSRFKTRYGLNGSDFASELKTVRRSLIESSEAVEAVSDLHDALSQKSEEFQNTLNARNHIIDVALPALQTKVKIRDQASLLAADNLQKLDDELTSITRTARVTWVNTGIVERIFSFIPSVRRASTERIRIACQEEGLPKDIATTTNSPEAYIRELEAYRSEELGKFKVDHLEPTQRELHEALTELASAKQALKEADSFIANYLDGVHRLSTYVEGITADAFIEGSADDLCRRALDLILRRRCFDLAMRYREGQFILNGLNGRHDQKFWGNGSGKGSRQKGERYFRELAKISPVFAGTVYQIAKETRWFDREKPNDNNFGVLDNFVDLLVIDESGQVSPHLGAPLLGLAKRALIVGDVFQLEPVINIAEHISHRIAASEGLSSMADEFEESGLMAHNGSMMIAAQRSTHVTDPDIKPNGIMLREHFRCARSIISYCNDLVYSGNLIPRVEDADPQWIPHLASAHIRGRAFKSQGSWKNVIEAATICDWVARKAPELRKRYPAKELSEIIAVVTPYRSQRDAIIQSLKERIGADADDITVGTVHALQGAERPIVIFSPTVTVDDGGNPPFFDNGPNMLNVAISRAKDAFIVMGDMTLFDPATSTPSGILAKHLLKNPSSMLEDVVPIFSAGSQGTISQRLTNWQEHDREFERILRNAREKVLISSFNYASNRAIQGRERVDEWILDTARRGVKVQIFIGIKGTQNESHTRLTFAHLSKHGVVIIPANNLHTKTVLADNDVIIEGSFNWLQARGGESGFDEASILITGQAATEHNERAWKEFQLIRDRVESKA